MARNFSGRTSRLEIRKLLWECLFWRFQRTPIDQKDPGHSFLFDDDEDTDRFVQGQVQLSHAKVSHRSNYLTPKSSMGNYSLQPSHTSSSATSFACCGFTIDLSQKPTTTLYPRPNWDDSTARRSLKTKKSVSSSPSKNLCVQSSISSTDRTMKPQRSICYGSNNFNRPITRRRAATVVHCSRKAPLSTITTLETSLPKSLSKNKMNLSREKFPSIVDIPSPGKELGYKTTIYLTEPSVIIQTDREEILSPASIIERC